jgi:hypothetical protein
MALPHPDSWKALRRLIEATEAKVQNVLHAFLGMQAPSRREQVTRLAEIKEILRRLDDQTPREARKIVELAYDKGARATVKVPQVKLFDPQSNFSNIHREAVDLLADNLSNRLGDASATLGRRVDDVFRKHALRIAAEQALQELPVKYQAGRLRQRLEAEGLTAFEDKAGRRWNLTTYAEMAVRTTVAEAHSQAVVNNMLARKLDLVRVDHHEHEEDVCSPYDGNTYSLTGATEGWPVLDIRPPFHPNCKHTILPSPEAFKHRIGAPA